MAPHQAKKPFQGPIRDQLNARVQTLIYQLHQQSFGNFHRVELVSSAMLSARLYAEIVVFERFPHKLPELVFTKSFLQLSPHFV